MANAKGRLILDQASFIPVARPAQLKIRSLEHPSVSLNPHGVIPEFGTLDNAFLTRYITETPLISAAII